MYILMGVSALLVVCMGILWFRWRLQERFYQAKQSELEQEVVMRTEQFENLRVQKEEEINDLRKELGIKTFECVKEKTLKEGLEKEVKKLEDLFEKQDVLLKQQEKRLEDHFSNLSHQLVEKQREALRQENTHQLGYLLKPFREQLAQFQQEVVSLRAHQAKQQGEFSEQIKQMIFNNHQLSTQAHALTQALTEQKKLQGGWGEVALVRLLESCGLRQEIHFDIQQSFQTEDAKRHIPDVVVYLPEKHHLIIDSKMSLNAYMKSIQAQDPQTRELAIKQSYEAVKSHVMDLSAKSYQALPQLSSPDFVMMFMPLEGLYFTLLQTYPELYQWAFDRGIVLVSTSTLLPILRTVANVWVLSTRQEEVETLVKQAEGIYDKALNMKESIEKLGRGLSTCVQQYNKMVGQYSGRDSLVKKLARFKQVQIGQHASLEQPIKEVLEVVREDKE